MIDLEFVGTRDLTARIIKWGTISPVDHVQFVLPDGRRFGATMATGVDFLPAPPPGATVRRYRFGAHAGMLDFAFAQRGRPYDTGAVIAIATRITLHRDWRDARKWFCSELVAAAAEAAGHPLLNAHDIAVITPRDLMLSPWLTRIA